MDRKTRRNRWTAKCCLVLMASTGCTPVKRFKAWQDQKDLSYYQSVATKIEYPEVQSCATPAVANTPLPNSVQNPSELPTRDLTLNEAIHLALQSSEVFRNLGGTVVQGAAGAQTNLDPGLTEANPLGGMEAALSAFDAQLSTQLFWQKNNRPNNNSFLVLFPSSVEQTAANYTSAISKTTAYGTQFAFRQNVAYDNNNSPFRLFRSDFNGFFEAEMRHPFLQGSGSLYNRIAGPGRQIGSYNGVLIARINTDVSLADFEAGVISLMNDVETAYWELYFAYRALDAQVKVREMALKTWRQVQASREGGRAAADAPAAAVSQFYLIDSQVNESLAGTNGLYAAEQRLRYMVGMPPTDGVLLKPVDKPTQADVSYDWNQAVCDALTQRVEIRRQKWTIKRRELELIASRLNRRPRLDALTQYRWRGLGDHLIGSRNPDNQFESLYQNIFEGNYQEWQAGMELSMPVGFRQASAAVRFAQLNLARDVAVLQEQELRISHDLSNASRQMARSYLQVQANYNRMVADTDQIDVLQARISAGVGDQTSNFRFLLQTQQSLAASESAYHRALVDYSLAIRDFHRQKGSLLSYNQVQLAEAAWPGKAYQDAYERGRFFRPREVAPETPAPISSGEFDPSTVGM